jgi:hypothetical protein
MGPRFAVRTLANVVAANQECPRSGVALDPVFRLPQASTLIPGVFISLNKV